MIQNGTAPGLPLEGKVFAITGGASGIGLASAKSLAQKGAIVCIADVDQAALDSAGSFFTSQKRSFKTSILDVSKRSDVESWIGSIVSEFGRLDGAANVAGIIGKGHGRDAVADLDDNEWDRIIAVNLTGMMFCLRAELNRVVDGGSIVNVASIHGTKGMSPPDPACPIPKSSTDCHQPHPIAHTFTFVLGFARHAAYDASKHGVIGLTKAAAQENGLREVRVNAVAPGSIYTPLMQKHWDLSCRPAVSSFWIQS
jgi:NAD(P)-dependent dehydrogenase (short-subunit alcohol dehydrogenase family)